MLRLAFRRRLTICGGKTFSVSFSNESYLKSGDNTHFKGTGRPHPLAGPQPLAGPKPGTAEEEMIAADHTGRQQNHIWTKDELDVAMSTLYRHKPVTFSDLNS